MAVTLTKIGGPFIQPGKTYGVGYTFSVLFDTSFASGGEIIDLTSYFSYLEGGVFEGVDAVADAGYLPALVGPGRATAVTSTNVLIQMVQDPAAPAASKAACAFSEATSVNLSTVGALIFTAWGKGAIQSSWA